MNYLGFLCVGLGIFSMAATLLSLLISVLSKEAAIKAKARFFAKCFFPLTVVLLGIGFYLIANFVKPA